MTYQEIERYISEIPKFTKKHSLSHTKRFLEILQIPQGKMKILHVAGTNGKGSVCAYLDAMLRSEGKRTGLFISPHLVKMNERIMIDGVPVSDEVFSEVFTQTLGAVKQMEAEGLEHPMPVPHILLHYLQTEDRSDPTFHRYRPQLPQ